MGNPDREIGWTEDAAVIAAYLHVIEHQDHHHNNIDDNYDNSNEHENVPKINFLGGVLATKIY